MARCAEALWREGLRGIVARHVFTFTAGTRRSLPVVVGATVVVGGVAATVPVGVATAGQSSPEQATADVGTTAEHQCDCDQPPVGGDCRDHH